MTRISLLAGLVFIFHFGFGQKPKNDWEKMNLRDKVKSIHCAFQYSEADSVEKACNKKSRPCREEMSIFNENGNLIQDIEKNDNGKIISDEIDRYDVHGKISEKILYTNNPMPWDTTKYFYN